MSKKSYESRLSVKQKREICSILAIGCDRDTAAKYVGCSTIDVMYELQHDQEFVGKVRKAQASSEMLHMKNVQAAAKDEKHWRASVWWLERCLPERYARRDGDVVSTAHLEQFLYAIAEAVAGAVSDPEEQRQVVEKIHGISRALQMRTLDTNNVINKDPKEASDK